MKAGPCPKGGTHVRYAGAHYDDGRCLKCGADVEPTGQAREVVQAREKESHNDKGGRRG